jgi:hypothetical protein
MITKKYFHKTKTLLKQTLKILPIFQKKVVGLQGKEWLKDSVDQSVKEGNSVIAYK